MAPPDAKSDPFAGNPERLRDPFDPECSIKVQVQIEQLEALLYPKAEQTTQDLVYGESILLSSPFMVGSQYCVVEARASANDGGKEKEDTYVPKVVVSVRAQCLDDKSITRVELFDLVKHGAGVCSYGIILPEETPHQFFGNNVHVTTADDEKSALFATKDGVTIATAETVDAFGDFLIPEEVEGSIYVPSIEDRTESFVSRMKLRELVDSATREQQLQSTNKLLNIGEFLEHRAETKLLDNDDEDVVIHSYTRERTKTSIETEVVLKARRAIHGGVVFALTANESLVISFIVDNDGQLVDENGIHLPDDLLESVEKTAALIGYKKMHKIPSADQITNTEQIDSWDMVGDLEKDLETIGRFLFQNNRGTVDDPLYAEDFTVRRGVEQTADEEGSTTIAELIDRLLQKNNLGIGDIINLGDIHVRFYRPKYTSFHADLFTDLKNISGRFTFNTDEVGYLGSEQINLFTSATNCTDLDIITNLESARVLEHAKGISRATIISTKPYAEIVIKDASLIDSVLIDAKLYSPPKESRNVLIVNNSISIARKERSVDTPPSIEFMAKPPAGWDHPSVRNGLPQEQDRAGSFLVNRGVAVQSNASMTNTTLGWHDGENENALVLEHGRATTVVEPIVANYLETSRLLLPSESTATALVLERGPRQSARFGIVNPTLYAGDDQLPPKIKDLIWVLDTLERNGLQEASDSIAAIVQDMESVYSAPLTLRERAGVLLARLLSR